ncbi:MAG: hypothetical protein H7Y36_12770 [Armatimonadetes bacterium]|nr:hypothetical protein [Akkermansiaceae bacterium]
MPHKPLALLLLFSIFTPSVQAAPFKLLAIGDSLTEEYIFEFPFSAPDSDPTVANTRNWVELLHSRRPSLFSMGAYKPDLGSYLDYRDAGYEYNYGIPTATTRKWEDILYPEDFNILDFNTRSELKGDLGVPAAVLVFLGGNDLKSNYSGTYNDPAPPAFLAQIAPRLARIHAFVRQHAPANLPIIIATLPDISATPDIRLKPSYSDPARQAVARQRIADVNASVIAMASSLPHTYIARIDRLSDRIFDQNPVHLNGTTFTYYQLPEGNENPPLHLFCKDGFHPGTAAQALIANEILNAINQFASTPIPLFSNREILAEILLQNPDQPYLDWANGAGSQNENPDDDPLPNLVEYLLDTNPLTPNPALSYLPDGSASYKPSPIALRYANLIIRESETLTNDWQTVVQSRIQTLPDSTIKVMPSPTAKKLFYQLQATPNP